MTPTKSIKEKKEKINVDQANILAKAMEFFKRNSKMPNTEFALFSWIIPSLSRGLYWRIIPQSDPETLKIERVYPTINKLDHWYCRKIQNNKGNATAFLLEVDREYLWKICDEIMPPTIWTKELKENYKNAQESEIRSLYNDLMQMKQDKSSKNSPIICIYNQNIQNIVSKQNQVKRAYAVNIYELAYICDRAKYFIVAKGIGGKYDGQRFAPSELVKPNRTDFVDKFMETLRYTAGTNSIQIQISASTEEES